jgi:hypothetical protein
MGPWCFTTFRLVVYGGLLIVGSAVGGAGILLFCKTVKWASGEAPRPALKTRRR